VFQTQLHLLGELNEHINYVYVEVWSLMRYLSTFVGVAQQGSLYFAYLLYILVFAWRQGKCSAVLAVLLPSGWLIFCSSMVAQYDFAPWIVLFELCSPFDNLIRN
jgi:hypothetical protein